ncbi:MAG: helix-turn-helix domain-containing protein [Treponema sp.]|nr:helix-turn-helix domain-containing protein [Treponema sp.]
MEKSKDLRKILSKNIKTIRNKLHISQEKLAENADISHSYLTDIERCRTWVSDKTLQSLAKALNREVWELLFPDNEDSQSNADSSSFRLEKDKINRINNLIINKRELLNRTTNKVMEEIIMEINQESSNQQ